MTETVYTLNSDCGHHCGVFTSDRIRTVAHCPCPDCHSAPTGPAVSRPMR